MKKKEFYVAGFPSDIGSNLNVLRRARNDLAHMQPISTGYLEKLDRVMSTLGN